LGAETGSRAPTRGSWRLLSHNSPAAAEEGGSSGAFTHTLGPDAPHTDQPHIRVHSAEDDAHLRPLHDEVTTRYGDAPELTRIIIIIIIIIIRRRRRRRGGGVGGTGEERHPDRGEVTDLTGGGLTQIMVDS